MIVKLLTEHHLEFLSLKGGCTGSSESTLVKMSNCWKSHVMAQIILVQYLFMSFSANLLLKNSRFYLTLMQSTVFFRLFNPDAIDCFLDYLTLMQSTVF